MKLLLRVTPPAASNAAASRFDESAAEFLQDKLHVPQHLPVKVKQQKVKQQMALPLSHGGMGFRPLRRTTSAAYLSSYLQLRQESAAAQLPPDGSTVMVDLQSCLDTLHSEYPGVYPEQDLPTSATAVFAMVPKSKLQSTLVKAAEQEERRKFLAAYDDNKTVARITSLSTPDSSLWLTTKPTSRAFSMPDPVFCVLVRLMLGVPCADDLPAQCRCGTPLSEENAYDHWCACDFTNAARMGRHNGCVTTVRSMVSASGKPSAVEQLFRPGSRKRADLVTSLNGSLPLRTACDFSVITSTAKSWVDLDDCISNAENAKEDKYREFDEYELVPLIMDVYGRMGNRLQSFISQLASHAADAFTSSNPHKSAFQLEALFQQTWKRHLVHALMFGTAHMLISGALACKLVFSVGRLLVGPSARRLGRVHVTVPVP